MSVSFPKTNAIRDEAPPPTTMAAAFVPKYPKMLQRRVFCDEILIKENLAFVFVVLVGNELANALRVALAADGTAVDPVILVREDVLVLAGAVDDEAGELWGGIGSHGKDSASYARIRNWFNVKIGCRQVSSLRNSRLIGRPSVRTIFLLN